MKTTHRCPKCQHDRILYIACVADRYGSNSAIGQSTPMKIAHYERSVGTLLGMEMTTSQTAGELEAGVCRACGYTEFYTKDPGNIIVDGTYVRELPPPDAFR